MISLYTSYYPETNPERDRELLTCLRRNLQAPFIDRVCVLNEGGDLSGLGNGKLLIRAWRSRPTYADFFALINELTEKGDVNVIANTDIYFDETLAFLDELEFPNRSLVLTRRQVLADGRTKLIHHSHSQDAWIFQGKVRDVAGDFHLGIPMCDGRIAHEIRRAGYRLSNPAFSIRAFHLHLSGKRNYGATDEVPGPYRSVPLGNLLPLWKHVAMELWGGQRPVPYRWDLHLRMQNLLRKVRGRLKASFR